MTRLRFIASLSVLMLSAFAILYSVPNITAAGGGKVTGTIKLDGQPAHQRAIDMSKDPVCSKAHEGKPVTTENVVVGPNNGLANVVVYISQGLPESAANQAPSEPAAIDQKGCVYQPHIVALNVNQHMKVITDDPTAHNIHPMPAAGGGNIGWNKSQPPGSPPFDVTWKAEEIAIPVKCNIHPWMHSYIAVVKGPFGVSNGSGAFSIENVPPGTYTLTAWHEIYGTQTQKITVAAGKPVTADFSFKAK